MTLDRRLFMLGGIAAIAVACSRRTPNRAGVSGEPQASAAASRTILPPTPTCDDGDDPTPPQTEGPYFTPDSPEKTDLAADVDQGTKLVLSGTVLATDCSPISRALIDVWQADDDGAYDNDGYRLRGHLFTDDEGRYSVTTIVPGNYPGRTRHIHVKVQAPDGPVLTTQLYFPDEPQNASDGIFIEECLIDIRDDGNGKAGSFTFVVET